MIKLESATAEDTGAAKRSLEALARSWGQQITEGPAQETAAAGVTPHDDRKVVDPVTVASLVVSIPPAALAVLDRIRKRRRARELIEHARHLAVRQVNVYLILHGRATELRTLTPDQLLDQLAGEDPPLSQPDRAVRSETRAWPLLITLRIYVDDHRRLFVARVVARRTCGTGAITAIIVARSWYRCR